MKIQNLSKQLALSILFIIFSCSSTDDGDANQDIANRTSSCPNAVSWTGAFWDSANGIPVALNGPLFIPNPGDHFSHPIPILNFTIPDNYTATEVSIPQIQAVGADVIRNDGNAIYRWIPSSFILQVIPSQTVIASQINALFSTYGFNGTPEVLCSEFRQQIFEGIPMEFNARLLRFDGRIAQVYVTTTYVASGTTMTISLATAPENEYEAEIVNTFWPINFQLFVRDDGNIVDQDGDGFTLLEDPDDTNPNVPVNQNN